MTTTTRPRRPTAPPWTDADSAGLAAILDAPRPARAVAADAESPLVVHCKRAAFDVYIGRPADDAPMHYGNPFAIKDGTKATVILPSRNEAIAAFYNWLAGEAWQDIEPTRRVWIVANLPTLRGKVLGCWCAPQSCHGDVLAALANAAALPSGYAVRLDGTIATLTLPNGGCCAFDGRERTATGYGPADAGRALAAAHTEAQRHATIAMHPPVVGRRGAIRAEAAE